MKKIIIFIFWSMLFLLSGERIVFATDPHLFLSPNSGNYSSRFSLEVRVDTGGQAVGGVDVYLEFPKNLLRAESVDKGTAFPEVYPLIKNEEGKLRISAYFPFSQAGNSFNGSNGLVATINFTPLSAGTAEVKFICTQKTPPETTDCNIIEKTEVKDIIVCSANENGSYSLTTGGGGSSTPTPTPFSSTSTPTPSGSSGQGGASITTSTPTPTILRSNSSSTPTPPIPNTGFFSPTLGLIGLGVVIILTGLLLAF